MADTYGLQGEGYGVEGLGNTIPLQPLADEARNAAKEFAKLLEVEQQRTEQARQHEFLTLKQLRAAELRASSEEDVASAYEKAAQAGSLWQQRVERIGSVMQSLAGGNVGGALGGVFGWMAERGKDKDGKDNPVTLTNAIGTWGGVVVGAFQAVGGAAMGLVGMLKSASPAFAGAWGEVIENLMAKIGVHLMPVLMPLATNIMMYSDMIAEWVGKVAVAIKDAIEFIYNLLKGEGKSGKAAHYGTGGAIGGVAAGAAIGSFIPGIGTVLGGVIGGVIGGVGGGAIGYATGDEKGGLGGGKGGPGGGGKAVPSEDAIEMTRLFVDSMKVHQGNKPAFEGVESAWKRIMQSEAGTSDLRKQNLKLQQKMVEIAEKQLAEMIRARRGGMGDGSGSGMTAELGPDKDGIGDFGAG